MRLHSCYYQNLISNHSLNCYAAVPMKIWVKKTEELYFWRQPDQVDLQMCKETLKWLEVFKYRNVIFASDCRHNKARGILICKANAIMCELQDSVVRQRVLSKHANFQIVNQLFPSS